MSLEIGQWRYGGSGCMSPLTPVLSYRSTALNASGSEDNAFKDVQINLDGGDFIKGRDYYLKLTIPQDMNYQMSFDINLVQDTGQKTDTFQFLKNVTIERGGTGVNAFNVVLYEDSNGEVKAMVPLIYQPELQSQKDLMYYNEPTDEYYIGVDGGGYEKADKYNDLSVVATWREEEGEDYGVFEIVFRPVDDKFSYIILQMLRTAQDYNIQRLNEDGSMEFGRKVDIKKVKCELYAVNDIVPKITSTHRLNRIGVWGHPGLIMIINGEEIHVGPSGYYEEDVLPIDSLGVVARDNDYSAYFTVDYEYDPDYVE